MLNLLAIAFPYSVGQTLNTAEFIHVFEKTKKSQYRILGIFAWIPALWASESLLSPDFTCLQILSQVEHAYNIPPHLLKAIALTESGRQTYRGFRPWPWTINVSGKGYFFDSKRDAIQAVKRFQRQGHRSIDVGCMQVNLFHHPHAFRSLEEAFDPTLNIQYGAAFLKRLQQSHAGQWKQAAAHYHSANPWHHQPYLQKVLQIWEQQKGTSLSRDPVSSSWQKSSSPDSRHEDRVIDPDSPITRVPPLRTFQTWKAVRPLQRPLQRVHQVEKLAVLPLKPRERTVQKVPPVSTRYRLSYRPLHP